MDRTYTLVAKSGAGNGSTNVFGEDDINDTFFKECNIPIEYDNSATTGVITSMRTNNIGVLLLSRDGAIGIFVSKMRIRYTDGS